MRLFPSRRRRPRRCPGDADPRPLEVGQKAPDFTLAAPGGKQVKLAELTAKGPVLLYTFVQAFTGT